MGHLLERTHGTILSLQQDMVQDAHFRALCEKYGLPWDTEAGYEPRWYNGPAPDQVRVLMLMAEPGPITPTEADNLLPAISHTDWIGDYDLRLQEHYWRENLLAFCRAIWPENTQSCMYRYLGGSCTFWMSLPHGSTTDTVPMELVDYFLNSYLKPFLAQFPNATMVAAGGKSSQRLNRLGVPHEKCWAFTRPGCNRQEARDSWARVGAIIAEYEKARHSTGAEC